MHGGTRRKCEGSLWISRELSIKICHLSETRSITAVSANNVPEDNEWGIK
jgi:hypothetical protein